MTTRTAVPTSDKILAIALQRFYALRPRSFEHINLRSGRYWQPWLGFRAQIATNIARLSRLVTDSFASTAKGEALIAWVASECAESPDTAETTAIGSLTIGRGDGSTNPAGDIPKGTRFPRAQSTSASVTIEPAVYETLTDAHFDVDQTTPVTIPIRATRPGAHANHPIVIPELAHGVSTPTLFDPTLEVTAFEAAGGAGKMIDGVILRFAKAATPGLYGPTRAASTFGALRTPGVRHCIAFDDPLTGTQRIVAADESWASSSRFSALVERSMFDDGLIGFGCKVSPLGVRNKLISVDLTVRLRDRSYLSDTTVVDEAIKKATRAYFDDRADWNVWKASGLKGAIVRAHRSILNCTSVLVKDTSDSSTLSEIVSPNYTQEQFHYQLANNAMRISYLGPV